MNKYENAMKLMEEYCVFYVSTDGNKNKMLKLEKQRDFAKKEVK